MRSEFKTQPILCITTYNDCLKWSTEARQNAKSVKLWIIIIKIKTEHSAHTTRKWKATHTHTHLKLYCTQILSCTYWFKQSFEMSFGLIFRFCVFVVAVAVSAFFYYYSIFCSLSSPLFSIWVFVFISTPTHTHIANGQEQKPNEFCFLGWLFVTNWKFDLLKIAVLSMSIAFSFDSKLDNKSNAWSFLSSCQRGQ